MLTDIEKICNQKDFITDHRYQEVIEPLKNLAVSRSEKYGNSIAMMNDTSIVDLCMMKLIRTKNLLKEDNPSDKYYDEIGDTVNYLIYLLRRQADIKQLPKFTQGEHNL